MRLSLVLSLVILAPLPIVGCGTGRSELAGDDAGVGAHGDDAGGCPASVPTIACLGCYGNVVPLECVDGSWECPSTPCLPPPPIDDAGVDACSSMPPLGCDVPAGCSENASWPVCFDGQWTCAFDGGGCWDAEPPPPPPPPDASDDGNVLDASPPPPPFECGDIACDPATTYCQIDTGGAVEDAGGSTFTCEPLSASCGGAATCGCAQGPTPPPGSCDCVEQNGDVIVTCAVP